MVNARKSNRGRKVEMTWVPVRDRHGRTHMELRWNVQWSAGEKAPQA